MRETDVMIPDDAAVPADPDDHADHAVWWALWIELGGEGGTA